MQQFAQEAQEGQEETRVGALMMGWDKSQNKPYIGFDVDGNTYTTPLEYDDVTKIQNASNQIKTALRGRMESPASDSKKLNIVRKVTVQALEPENPLVQVNILLTDGTDLEFIILPDQHEQIISSLQSGQRHAEQAMQGFPPSYQITSK